MQQIFQCLQVVFSRVDNLVPSLIQVHVIFILMETGTVADFNII